MRNLSATLCSATLLFSLGAIATLASCGSPAAATPPPPAAPTVSVVANPATITQGNSSMLAVTATNATQVVISDNSDSSSFTLAVAGGTRKRTATETTAYTGARPGPDGGDRGQSSHGHAGKRLDADGHRQQCDAGRDLRQPRQHDVYAAGDGRNAASISDCHDNLHGDCHRRRRNDNSSSRDDHCDFRARPCRHDQFDSDFNHAGDFLHFNRHRQQCNAGGDLQQCRQHDLHTARGGRNATSISG